MLEGGHLLLQRGGDRHEEGATFDGLEVEEAQKHKQIGSVMRLDSPEASENYWGGFIERQRHLSTTACAHTPGLRKFAEVW